MVKNLRKLKNNETAGVATYFLIMLGLMFMLYLFGFTNMWSSYQTLTSSSLESSSSQFGADILGNLANAFADPDTYAWAGVGIVATLGAVIVGKLTGTLSTILTFLIPILLLVILNIFVFPINALSAETQALSVGGISIAVFLLIFFNGFYILAVLEFIRGNI